VPSLGNGKWRRGVLRNAIKRQYQRTDSFIDSFPLPEAIHWHLRSLKETVWEAAVYIPKDVPQTAQRTTSCFHIDKQTVQQLSTTTREEQPCYNRSDFTETKVARLGLSPKNPVRASVTKTKTYMADFFSISVIYKKNMTFPNYQFSQVTYLKH